MTQKKLYKAAQSMGRKGDKTTAKRHNDKQAEWGRRGGNATLKKYGPEHFSKIRKGH